MMKKALLCLFYTTAVIFSCSGIAFSDELSESKTMIKNLQEENRSLQEQLNRQKESIERLSARMESLEQGKPLEPMPKKEPVSSGLKGFIEIPRLNIKGFSDIGFSAKATGKEGSDTFTLGGLDLFITSKLSEKVGFLAELFYEFNSSTNAVVFDLERVSLRYSLSDLFNITIGRVHTALGYWNPTFHHGAWLQTTVFRPEVYLFEDDNGILPLHQIGVELSGIKEFAAFDGEYNFAVSNGRGKTVDEIQNAADNNNSKAINALFSIKPHSIEGLKLGTSIYYDRIPPNLDNTNRVKRIDELILGGQLTYIHNKVELLGEFFNINHRDKTSEREFDTNGFYLQAGYKFNKLTPYYRFDFIDFETSNPYFTSDDDLRKNTLGLRWDMFNWNALKVEYSFKEKSSNDEHLFTVNSSFCF